MTGATDAPRGQAAAGEPEVRSFGRWTIALLLVGFWTGYGLIYGVRERTYTVLRSDDALAWGEALKFGLYQSYVLALVALAAFYVARRLPLERRGWPRNVALHAIAAVVVIGAVGVLMHLTLPLISDAPSQPLKRLFVGNLPAWSLIYLSMLSIGYGFEYFRRYRVRELRAAQLESALSRAQLQALKMQLHPHFLFNTLNSISALMHRDVAAADRMLSRLEDLLRMTLEQSQAQEVQLQEELRVLEPYLEIEQTRFGQRLRVVWDVEPETLDACVPHLILQPLIENAIKHGIAPRSSPGRIAIVARRVGDELELEVRDNGPGPSEEGFRTSTDSWRSGAAEPGGVATARRTRSGGVGLANTRARLAQLYDGAASFEIAASPEGGTLARIRLPIRFAS